MGIERRYRAVRVGEPLARERVAQFGKVCFVAHFLQENHVRVYRGEGLAQLGLFGFGLRVFAPLSVDGAVCDAVVVDIPRAYANFPSRLP